MDIRGFFSGAAKKTTVKQVVSVEKVTSMSDESPDIVTSTSIVTSSVVTEISKDSVTIPSNTPLPKELLDLITWKAGESVPYSALAETFERVAGVSGRLEKEYHFVKLFRSVILTNPDDLVPVVYLCSNCVFPAYEGSELGIGDSILVKAVCEATGRNKDAVEADYQREGDLGVVALSSRSSQKTLSFVAKPKPLPASFVLDQLRVIANIKGGNAQGRKIQVIKALMVRCMGPEAKYLIRSLQGKLRIGTAAQTVLVSLGQAFVQSPPLMVQEAMGQEGVPINSIESEGDSIEDMEDMEDISNTDEECEETDIIPDEQNKPIHDDDDVVNNNSNNNDDSNNNNNNGNNKDNQTWQQQLADLPRVEPPEAKKLRLHWHRLRKENKQELAVIAVKRGFSECPNLTILVQSLLKYPLYELYQHCQLCPGVPIAPMLAKPTKEIGEVLRRLSGLAFTMEYKYDGERAQVHLTPEGKVKIYSRNSEDNTEKYPDLMAIVNQAKEMGVESFVFDAEVVAFDREKSCLLPFQVLSTRKRKAGDGDDDSQKVKVVLQAFDLLYLNGKSLLTCPLRLRRQLLRQAFHEEVGYFYFASGLDHVENGDTAPIEMFMQEACTSMCEGLMVKTLDDNASYEPSKRSLNWLKLKKDYIEGMGVCDSVDLVVIGGYHGRGKRVNVYGAYLMACYDSERDEFQSVCKVGTGFKDEDLIRLTERMKPLVIGTHKKPINYNVGDALEPDDWFAAQQVWELQAADLSKSSVHKGALGRVDPSGNRGVGLRFPRFLRERDDKKPENATNSEQIADMYFSQGEVDAVTKDEDDDEDDFL